MSLQASWNTAMGSVAGALHLQDVRKRMGEAEERRIAREQRQTAGSNRVATIETEMAQNESANRSSANPGFIEGGIEERLNARLTAKNAMDRIYQMSREEAAERAQMHLDESDTAENNLNAVVEAMRSRSTRNKFRRRRELRRKREGRMRQDGTTETT